MNKHKQDHSDHRREDKPRRQYHRDWRVWLGVIVMLAALATYVLTLDDRIRPAAAPEPVAPVAPVR